MKLNKGLKPKYRKSRFEFKIPENVKIIKVTFVKKLKTIKKIKVKIGNSCGVETTGYGGVICGKHL